MPSTLREGHQVESGTDNRAVAPAPEEPAQSPLQAAVLQRKIQRRLARKADGAPPATGAMGQATTKTAVKLRETPAGKAIGGLKAGATVKVLGRETVQNADIGGGEWFHIELDGGATGWITAQPEYVTFTATQAAPATDGKAAPASGGGGEGAHQPSLLDKAQQVASDAGQAIGGALDHLAGGLSSLWSKTVEGVDHLLDGDSGKGGQGAGADKKPADTKGADTKGSGSDAKKDTKVTKGDGTHSAILDPKAYLRTDPPELKSTGNVIAEGTIVDIVEEQVVKGKAYVKVKTPEGAILGWTSKSNLGSDREVDADLQPSSQIDVSKLSGLDLKMAEIHNMKGKFLEEKAAALGCDAAALGAVLKVESAGHGFASDGRMIIRFENHVFNKQWGKDNKAIFDKHFKYNADQSWTGHYWRREESGQWISCHGSQDSEWEVLAFARSLNDEGALKSASYGAGQVMGFNFANAGYADVTDMFTKMSGALRPQLDGMFGFISNNPLCIAGLKNKDYVKFATGYNGAGKAEEYGAVIQEAAAAYERVVKNAKPKANS